MRCEAPIGLINSFCYLKILISDQIPPEITCPVEITSATNPVSWDTPRVIDDIDNMIVPTCSPPSNSVFPTTQPTLVTCTAVDSAGNSDQCTFLVKIGQYHVYNRSYKLSGGVTMTLFQVGSTKKKNQIQSTII